MTRPDEPHTTAAGAPERLRRLGVFVSGTGRSLVNLHEQAERLSAQIVLVIADRPCRGLEYARQQGVHAELIERPLSAEELTSFADRHALDLVVLAGYLRKVPVPPALAGRVVNIHPALLPSFGGRGMYGMRVHEAVLEAAHAYGLRESGCTVHLCDEAYDTGPIVLQRRCPILPGDTPQALADRVFEQELIAYPQAIAMLLDARAGQSGGSSASPQFKG